MKTPKPTEDSLNDSALVVAACAIVNNPKVFKAMKGGQKDLLAAFIKRFSPFKPIPKTKR